MNVDFVTSRFVASHGREPRGRGCWMFEDCFGAQRFMTRGNTSYTEAKKEFRDSLSVTQRSVGVAVWVSP